MNRRLYVGNLPYLTTESDLRRLFSTAGPVRSVQVMRHQETGYPRGFALVEMVSPNDAVTAISRLDASAFGGRILAVIEAKK